MPDYTTVALLEDIRSRAGAPNATAQGTTDTDLLRIASGELLGEATALLRRINEDHLVAVYTVAIVQGQSRYPLPERAIGGSLKDATVVRVDGSVRDLLWLDSEELSKYGTQSGEPTHFYFEDQQLVLYPTPAGTSETLRLPYFRRCSELVLPSACGLVTSATTNTISVSGSVPGTFTTAQLYDVVQGRPPFAVLAMDLVPTNVGSGTVVFGSDVSALGIRAGDYLCLSGESPVIQMPREMHQYVAQATCVKTLSGPFGDLEQRASAMEDLNRLRDEVLPDLLKDRTPGAPIPLFNPYNFGGGSFGG